MERQRPQRRLLTNAFENDCQKFISKTKWIVDIDDIISMSNNNNQQTICCKHLTGVQSVDLFIVWVQICLPVDIDDIDNVVSISNPYRLIIYLCWQLLRFPLRDVIDDIVSISHMIVKDHHGKIIPLNVLHGLTCYTYWSWFVMI